MDSNTLIITSNLQLAINAVNRQTLQLDIQEYIIDAKCECDECRDLLSINDKAAITSVFVASPTIFTGIMSAAKIGSIALVGAGSFGISAIAGGAMYLGYKWLAKSYYEAEDLKKAQWAVAKENHRLILNQVRTKIEKIIVTQKQFQNIGQITLDGVVINYKENECPICLESLVVEDDDDSCSVHTLSSSEYYSSTEPVQQTQKVLERFLCGHVLHKDCLQQKGLKNCPFCQESLTSTEPEFVVLPITAPTYSPHTVGQFVKEKITAAMKETKDLLTIAGKIISDVTGATLLLIGGGLMVLWIPMVVPVMVFIGIKTGNIVACIEGTVCALGLASTAVAGGIMLCSFGAK